VVGCTTGSREVPRERKRVIREDDDDDDDEDDDETVRYLFLDLRKSMTRDRSIFVVL
jgi:hypothetical protein